MNDFAGRPQGEPALHRAVVRMAQRMMDMEVEDRHTSFPADVQGMAQTLLAVALEELGRDALHPWLGPVD